MLNENILVVCGKKERAERDVGQARQRGGLAGRHEARDQARLWAVPSQDVRVGQR